MTQQRTVDLTQKIIKDAKLFHYVVHKWCQRWPEDERDTLAATLQEMINRLEE